MPSNAHSAVSPPAFQISVATLFRSLLDLGFFPGLYALSHYLSSFLSLLFQKIYDASNCSLPEIVINQIVCNSCNPQTSHPHF